VAYERLAFVVLPVTPRNGEFAALGLLDKGTRRVDILVRVLSGSGIDTSAIKITQSQVELPEGGSSGGCSRDVNTSRKPSSECL
jgi:hypothetical protein